MTPQQKARMAASIARATAVHGDRFDYSKTVFSKQADFATIICREHGEFSQRFHSHIAGYGCAKCAAEKSSRGNSHPPDRLKKKFLAGAKKVHGKTYDYSRVSYVGKAARDKVSIVCPEHGEFQQTFGNHVTLKHGCPKCRMGKGRSKSWPVTGDRPTRLAAFRKLVAKVHGDKYTYPNLESEFDTTSSKITVICEKHGEFYPAAHNHAYHRSGCPNCRKSKGEDEVYKWVRKLLPREEVRHNDRRTLGGKELDIYLPGHQMAIEYCGVYWHADDRMGIAKHAEKQKACADLGIRLITVFDVEWQRKDLRVLLKNRIRNALGKSRFTAYARCLEVQEVTAAGAERFLLRNHYQGASVAKVRLGLRDPATGELLSLMTFGKPRFAKGVEWELVRFCSDRQTSVVGGQSKLFKHFLRAYAPRSIVSYADLRWGVGGTYEMLGFNLSRRTAPAPWYAEGAYVGGVNKLHHRMAVQKHRLPKMLKTFDPSLTASENLRANNWFCVYDCGTNVYLWEASHGKETNRSRCAASRRPHEAARATAC